VTDLVCIGAPYLLGAHLPGRTAVEAVRNSGITDEMGAIWVDIEPDFNESTDPIVAVNRALAHTIQHHAGRLPVIFTADCLNALGVLKGIEQPDPAVIWYDAHGDFNTHDTTPSGFLGGMPLAMLVGRGRQYLMEGIGLKPIREKDVILTDARDLNPGEAVALRESAVTHLTDTTQLLTTPLPDKPIYIHLDADVVDPDDMPALSYPTQGGPSLTDVAATIQRIARESQVAAILFSLWNNERAADQRPLESTLALVRAFLKGLGSRGGSNHE